ncbi:type II secretion system protein E [Candidatus Saccharibacteria bacterium CG10_big_fil_rev_8_21_14_0_10_47_8]|nr:MAG: type II secretion system protein E [Candidatus Saccharibacteria bacterium CG10_big_fil_rev_8_21_14_0_10_47_8]
MSVLLATSQRQVEQELVKDKLITADELALYKSKAAKTGQPLFSLLIKEGRVSDEDFTRVTAHVNQIPYVNLNMANIGPKVLELLPQETAEYYMAVPLGSMDDKLVVAMLDAENVQAVDFLSKKIGQPLKAYAASESGIRRILKQYEKNIQHGVTTMLEKTGEEEDAEVGALISEGKKVQVIVQDSPISKALSAIIDFAAKNRASDIHIEPLEKELKIRCRVDGVLREIMKLPKSTEAPLVSRIKILANLKIDEHRIPQDGQFTISADGRPIDLRIAVSPVVWGEQIVIRLLDKTGTNLMLEDMGYTGRALRLIRQGLKLPYGMILTSGPTGSGKSTSMYAMIQEIKSDATNIVTLEDPVEYKIEGVNQIQVNAEVGLTFATGLRSILRQDPDVVMVGEIRDKETANLAVQAALTGHLVFATLHTNSAAGILPRLLDMGIEPFLIASTVHTVIGQRLVRRVVPGGETYHSNKTETVAIHNNLGSLLPKTRADVAEVAADLGYQSLPLAGQNAYTLVKGQESPENPMGYQGRMGLYEVFEVTEAIQDLIIKHATSSTIQRMAQSQGMVSMRQDGYLKALAGQTTLMEVNRVAAADG